MENKDSDLNLHLTWVLIRNPLVWFYFKSNTDFSLEDTT